MQLSTTKSLSVFDDIFNPEVCHQLARECKFIQRSTSKIQGHEFAKALILPSKGLSEDSLNGLCERMTEFNSQANISAAALAQRINTQAAVRFMRTCFSKLLQLAREKIEKQIPCLESSLNCFKNIYIQDSTVFEINRKLARFFPGTKRGGKKGGISCKSQIKIDLIHNFATGQIQDTQIYEGKRPDQALSERIINFVQKGDLVLRDLGYFKIDCLKKTSEIGAYFLTRFASHVKVFLNPDDENPIDLATYLNKYDKHHAFKSLNVWLSDQRMPARLVFYRVPKEIANERRRIAHQKARERGRKLSKEKIALCEFSLFICNIPQELVPDEVIGTIYRVRWEIELIFKTWKSQLKIDVLEGVCLHRILCLIWSRLCTIILVEYITAHFFNLAKKLCKGELSPVKLINYFLRNNKLAKAIQNRTLDEFEERTTRLISRMLLKDKRARTTMKQRLIDSESYYGWGRCA